MPMDSDLRTCRPTDKVNYRNRFALKNCFKYIASWLQKMIETFGIPVKRKLNDYKYDLTDESLFLL